MENGNTELSEYERRKKRNNPFIVWLPTSLKQWFMEYLEKVSYGPTPSERFRVFLF